MSRFVKLSRSLILNLILWSSAIGLTLLSIGFQQPSYCTIKSLCWESPCTDQQVACSHLRAGFPFPFVFDQTAGSPVSGWMKISTDDDVVTLIFILNIIAYRLVFFIILKIYTKIPSGN